MFKEETDCLWLVLEPSRGELTFPTALISEIDWKLRGFLSRILRKKKDLASTVFFPVRSGIPARVCAVDTVRTFEIEKFQKNLEGLKAEKVTMVFESEKVKNQMEKILDKAKKTKTLKKLHCIEDQA